MSLLNEVLRDLDARQAEVGGRRPLPSAVRPLPARADARRPWVVPALLGALAVAALVAFVLFGLPTQDPRPADVRGAVVESPAPSSAPSEAPASVPALAVATPAAAAPAVDVPAAVASDAQQPAAMPPAPAPKAKMSAKRLDPPLAAGDATPPAGKNRVPPGTAEGVAPLASNADKSEKTEKIEKAEKPEKLEKAEKVEKVEKVEKAEKPGRAAIERSDAVAAPGERVDAEYRKAISALNQGRVAEAIDGLRGVLRGDPLQRAARQLLVKVLIEAGRTDEAIDVLREGVRGQPAQIGWAMALARLQVDRGDLPGAWTTLDESLPAAGHSADYQGFAGNVLQRLGRSREAIARFQAAVRLAPGDGRWWLGLGLAHDAEGENDEARAAFLHARQTANLTPELLALVERKLRQ